MNDTISRQLIAAQDDGDTVVLPNACPGELIQLEEDSGLVRCFSIMTKQPHAIPPEHWSLVKTPTLMPPIAGQHSVCDDKFLADHVTRAVIGQNALQLNFDNDGALRSIRLLPPGNGPAQQQWAAQAKQMIDFRPQNT